MSSSSEKQLIKCILKSSDPAFPSVEIGSEKVYIGRNRDCRIQSIQCSKKQISAKISVLSNGETVLFLNRMGTNPSSLNGQEMKFFIAYEAKDGDKLEPVKDLGLFYTVEFKDENDKTENVKTPNNEKLNSDAGKRRSSTDLVENDSKKIRTTQENVSPNSSQSKTNSLQCPDDNWDEIDGGKLYIFTSKGVQHGPKIAGYDIDGTIIKTKSGNVFPKNIDDWQIAFSQVPGKLKSLHKDGYKIVFFTNQAGISSGKLKITEFRKKVERIISKLNIPVQVFISTGKGKYRKPILGMWETLEKKANGNFTIDLSESFYCGDAAGRPEKKGPSKRKKDFSCSDRLFAMNIGVKFYTPEENFQNAKQDKDWTQPGFDPKTFNSNSSMTLTNPPDALKKSVNQEVIVMVGMPASGKSSFARKHFETSGYAYINRDSLGSWQKCVSALEKAIQENKSAVIDNTNPDAESRKRYIEVAKKRKIPCRCFVMATTEAQAKHNNVFRELTDPFHSVIKDMVFHGYKSKFQEPSLKEGFTQIVKVNCIPKFDDPEKEKLYKMYLVEK
uniref:CSON000292 protein n=1 Tax=Culicoides sonorensis TaxID=179676 RepID=A0A336MJT2_CULSO